MKRTICDWCTTPATRIYGNEATCDEHDRSMGPDVIGQERAAARRKAKKEEE